MVQAGRTCELKWPARDRLVEKGIAEHGYVPYLACTPLLAPADPYRELPTRFLELQAPGAGEIISRAGRRAIALREPHWGLASTF